MYTSSMWVAWQAESLSNQLLITEALLFSITIINIVYRFKHHHKNGCVVVIHFMQDPVTSLKETYFVLFCFLLEVDHWDLYIDLFYIRYPSWLNPPIYPCLGLLPCDSLVAGLLLRGLRRVQSPAPKSTSAHEWAGNWSNNKTTGSTHYTRAPQFQSLGPVPDWIPISVSSRSAKVY